MKGTINIRIYASTFNKLKRKLKLERNETMAHYFERLNKHIEDWEDYTGRDLKGGEKK